MDDLRRAADDALRSLGDQADGPLGNQGAITRLTIDVEGGKLTEIVSLRMGSDQLSWSCSCGKASCTHAITALRFVAGVSDARNTRTALDRQAARTQPKAEPRSLDLAEALDDVVTSVVRAGVANASNASIAETLQRLIAAAGSPVPLGLSRWIARLQRALDLRDVSLAAHALACATKLSTTLREGAQSADAIELVTTFLGVTIGDDRAITRESDRTFIEIAREWLPGVERSQIERRYLIDLHSGERYREERLRRDASASLGPCPRRIEVGFAEVERGVLPRRARVLQYTTSPVIDAVTWRRVESWAERDFTSARDHYRAGLSAFGVLSEPFVLLAPTALRRDDVLGLVDERGQLLPLHQDEDLGWVRRFEDVAAVTLPAWVAGRLLDRDGRMMLRPLAAGILRDDTLIYERL
jgi:hypothetical protein